ncbi:Ribokinase-like protein [Jimgerdemannia flammicorona]|uniref:Ribokinase n=1 Tax=Jimgerdemannia flammicorona TaxID=994334 RepID=A0A433Q487_9FUNG|nr:Ribokinase-like protein [Jimgerdemannia flammicorona]
MAKVLCFGSINLDEFYHVPHIVLAGETISSTLQDKKAGGKGANQSVALAKAGANVYHAGKIGREAIWIREYMASLGVDVSHVAISENEITGRAIIQLSTSTHDNAIVLVPGTNHTITPAYARAVLEDFGSGDWIVQQNEISSGGDIMRIAAEKGLSICFNPAPLTPSLHSTFPLHLVNILILNEGEARSLHSQHTSTTASPKAIARALLDLYPLMRGVVVTLGGEGLVALFRGPSGATMDFELPSEKVHVQDTTAAGDCFTGYLLGSLIRDVFPKTAAHTEDEAYFIAVHRALREANVAASLAVERHGAMESIPLASEVRERLERS